MHVTYSQQCSWVKDLAEKARADLKDRMGWTDEMVNAYEAGTRAGARDMLGILRLQGAVTTDFNR